MADYYGKNGELLNLEGLLNPVNNGNITSNYGFRSDPETGRTAFHTGIDFGVGGATDRNTISMLNGEVIRYGNSSTLGNFVAVKLENGTSIVYGHLDSIDSSIVTGVSVPQGTILGVTGNTGKSTGIHSHISWINQDATDVIINNTTGVEAKSGLSIFLTPDTVIDPTEYVEKASPNSVLEIKLNNYTQNPDLENQTLEEIIEDIKIHQTAEKLRNPNQTLINDITNPDESTKPLAQNVANSNKLTINNVVETTYPVVSGDTFFEIADKLIAKGIINLRQELIDMNDGNIEDINKLEVGDKIIIKKDVGNQNYDVHSGDQEKSISDNPNVQKDENGNVKLLDSEGNEISQEEGIITGFSSGNGYVEDDAFTLVKEGVFVPLIDGTKALLSSVVEMTEVGVTNISNFFQSKIMGIFQPLFDEIFSSKEESKDENGDTAAQRLAGSILADIILGKDIVDIAANFAGSNQQISQLIKDVTAKLAEEFPDSDFANNQYVQDVVAGSVIRFAIIILTKENMDGTDYAEAAGRALASETLAKEFGGGPEGSAAIAAIMSLYDSFQADSSMNSDQYEDAATSAAAAAAAAYMGHVIGTSLAIALGSVFPGVGHVVGYAIGYIIGSLLYIPFKNKFDDNIDGTKEMYDGYEDLLKGESAEENIQQIFKGLDDAFISSTGRFFRDYYIGLYNFFGGNYGQIFAEGEYPDPYSFLKIVAKEDGTGNTIYGVERDGVVAMTREYYHDDIYGTTGNDILVGKSGTNLLVGNDGDDMIEGRGDTDQIVGGNGDDIIEAGGGDDYVQGDAGDDLIYGDAGNDVIIGGAGNDIIYGGQGDDRIEGNEGNDIIYGQDGNDVITAGEGDDTIDGGAGSDTILGENGNDNINGGEGNDTIEGNAGNDILIGGEGNDNIRGGDGNDEIYGSQGIDMLYGDEGDDIINGGDGDDLIFGGLGNDIIAGGVGNDYIYGEIGNDYLIGGEGNDILDGFDGDDVLFAGKGNDTLDGGRGLDTFIFRNGDGQDIITDTDGKNDVIKFSDINSSQVTLTKDNNNLIITFNDTNGNITTDQITITDQLLNNNIIETLEFADGKKIDLTNISTNSDNTTNYTFENYYNIDTAIQSGLVQEYSEELDIDARDQVNTDSSWYADNYEDQANKEIENEQYNQVEWRSYKKKRSSFGGHYTVWYKYYEKNLKGTDGNDRIVGNWWSENIYGEGGDDQLYGNNGNDTIYGQDGNDYLNGGADNDTLYGGNGYDKIEGGTGDDTIHGGDQNDTLYGQWGNDTIYGNNHDDFIDGGEGDDKISGDINQADLAELEQELANLKAIPDYIIRSGFGGGYKKLNPNAPTAEQIEALEEIINNIAAGNDTILGGAGNDTITGDGGNDLIIGNDGRDDLSGNEGSDTIYGREGNDIINGNEGDDYISGGAGNDIITAGDGNDIIYGNNGIDVIDGNEGNDYIYGGAGDDIITAGDGNDYIYGGSGNNTILADQGDDYIVGGEDYDNIEAGDGNDIIISRSGADRIDGGAGNDTITAGAGNDILIDGLGSDNLIGGADNDIFIITKQNTDDNNQSITDIDVIEDFNKDEDRIIIKIDYQNPITFATLQNYLSQNGDDAEINFDNGQQIIIKNTLISDLTTDNLAIGLSGGEDNDILFGTDNNDILFGNLGDDQLYGGEGNDELFGEKGSDALYGQDGDDMLYYEADGTFLSDNQETLVGYKTSSHTDNNNPRDYYMEEDVAFKHDDLAESSYNYLYRWSTKHRRGRWGGHYLRYHSKIIYDNEYNFKHYFTKNFYNEEDVNINGYNRSFDSFKGGEGTDTLLLTDGNDMLALDDNTSNNPDPNNSRLQDLEIIYANDGDDIINLTSPNYTHGDIIIYGGEGNDRIWSSIGDDTLVGQDGNDEIYGHDGDDYIIGGDGDDILIGGNGDDIIEGGDGDDLIEGNAGDDIIEGGAGEDIIDGGEGNNTISYITSQEGINIDIKNNTASGGDAQGDIISNFDNIIGSNHDDNIIGNDNANIIEGKQGDDTLKGGLGADTYLYDIGDGNDIIDDQDQYLGDTIILASSINRTDLLFSESWNDLVINFFANENDSITIKNQLGSAPKINFIEFANGDDTIDLSNKTYIAQEDITYEIDLSTLEEEQVNQQNIILIAAYGTAIYNEDTALISYTPNQDFNGIDELTYSITDDDGNIIRSSTLNIMVSPINDNPFGEVASQEIMVDEEFSLNLNDFFSDIDGDNLTYLINVKDQIGLPEWISFNEETAELSGIFGRDGQVTIEVAVSDNNGGIHQAEFNIKANIDLSQRAIDVPDLVTTSGTQNNDVMYATVDQQDLLIADQGDDEINYREDAIWQDTDIISFFAWNPYSGDEISVNGKIQSFDSFDGGEGNDTLNLTDGDDVLFLDDPLTSSLTNSARISGIEIINGGLGDDIIDLSSLNYEYGDVELNGGDGDDVIWSNSGDDTLNGGNGNDNIQAGTGNDILNGGEGDDVLKGYDGDDILTGGLGIDILTGGFGYDSFDFSFLDDSTINKSDLITDFTQGEDSINFSNFAFMAIAQGEGGNGTIGYNYDEETDITTIADPDSDFALQLSGKIDLTNDDFVF